MKFNQLKVGDRFYFIGDPAKFIWIKVGYTKYKIPNNRMAPNLRVAIPNTTEVEFPTDTKEEE